MGLPQLKTPKRKVGKGGEWGIEIFIFSPVDKKLVGCHENLFTGRGWSL